MQRGGVLLVEVRDFRTDRQDAALWHGIAGVDSQVEQHLLDLAAISQYRGQVRRQFGSQVNMRPDAAGQQIADIGNDGVEIQRLCLGHLPPAEDEQLPGKRRGAQRRRLDLLRVVPHPGLGRLLGDKPSVIHDRRQQIVEVMSNPARQLAKSFEALRLMQLLLQPAPHGVGPVAFGHVPGHSGCPGHHTARIPDWGNGNRHVNDAPVLTNTFRLEILDPLSPPQPGKDRPKLARPVWRDKLRHIPADDLFGRVAVHLGCPGIPRS